MNSKRLFSLLLALFMLALTVCSLPFTVSADDGVTTLIAASDFQPKNGNESGVSTINDILKSIGNAGTKRADGFLFCGDFDFGTIGNAEETREGIDILKDTMQSVVDEKDMVLLQGNHDVPGTAGLAASGNNDPESGKYGVFVINNEDYMWHNKDEVRIKRTAQYLINYLNEKLENGYDKPIFVLSHLPLHYSMRTVHDGDGTYASYIFDALNEAGKKGLNIIFLFGHNHSNGWDDYLGGSSIYLAKGDEIQIAKNKKDEFEKKTLNFTYMNAGYIGYYDVNNPGAGGELSMSVFKIASNGSVAIARYNAEGAIPLKEAGVRNDFKEETAYDPNTKVYDKFQTVLATKVTDPTPIAEIMKMTTRGRQYIRVDSVDKLKDGGRYILIYNSDVDQILKPEVVQKTNASGTRVGLELVNVYGFGEQYVYGKYSDLEWTFTKIGNYWMVGREGKHIKITPTEKKAVTITLEDVGSPLTVDGNAVHTFAFGEYVFNYNARGLMNAYTADPAQIYIYEYVGYTLKVTDGSVTVGGEKVKTCDAGIEVSLTANPAAEGMRFDKWVVENGKLEGVDLTKETLTFKMPENALDFRAEYVEIGAGNEEDPTDTPSDTKDPAENEGSVGNGGSQKKDDGNTTVVLIIAISVVALAAIVGAVVVVKHKKS